MKRGGPLQRHTPLTVRTPMQAKQTSEAKPKPKPRRAHRDTGPSKETRALLAARSNGVCEMCGNARAVDPHHRHGRLMGGTRRPWINRLSNLLHACRRCHDLVTNTNGRRPEFEAAGWLLREGQDPLQVPVRLAAHGVVVLDDVGGFTPPLPLGGVA